MDVLLKPEMARFVDEKLRAGQYKGLSDMVNEALQVLKEQEEFTPAHEQYLRREVDRGLEQLNQKQHSDFSAETIISQERRRINGGKENATWRG
jgi:putative addiction module CopG family antidote